MTDLISGHRLMSVIKPMVGIFAADDEFYISYNAVLNAIEYAPTIDAVPVVRCKDCKHYQFADNRAFGMPVKMCKWFGFEDVDDYDFCSRAEPRRDIQHAESINLISAEPKRGKWNDIELIGYKAICSECGVWSLVMGNYCPNCGARMDL